MSVLDGIKRALTSYESMTIEQLTAENQRLEQEQEAIRAKRREIAKLMEQKLLSAQAQKRLQGLSDAEREALKQALANSA